MVGVQFLGQNTLGWSFSAMVLRHKVVFTHCDSIDDLLMKECC